MRRVAIMLPSTFIIEVMSEVKDELNNSLVYTSTCQTLII